MAVGHTRHMLTACALTPVGIIAQKEIPNEPYIKQTSTGITCDTATPGADASWVEVQYELQWEMLPVTVGRLALPPLQVRVPPVFILLIFPFT